MKLLTRALCATALLCICSLVTQAQVPVSLMPIPHQQFLAANGTPLAGGFVYTYVSGTSTPAPTYLDYTGTSQNTNPITLDAGGFASIWIPTGTIDVAVFNSSMVQQYKVLSVTALPSAVSSLTAGFFQSSTVNPALSGFIRAANTDSTCWRNGGNSADLCIAPGSLDQLFYTANGVPFEFAFLNGSQTWTTSQTFAQAICWEGGPSCLTNASTAARSYAFPDASGTVCLSTSCTVNTLTLGGIGGVTISGLPSAPGQALVSTSTNAATWGVGAIQDYDNYSGSTLITIPCPTPSFTLTTIPNGALEQANPVGSYIEGELVINNVAHTGSSPVFSLQQNTNSLGSFTMSDGVVYDVRFTIALSSLRLPQAEMNVFSNVPATTYVNYSQPGGVTAPVIIGYQVTGATAISLNVQFIHVRVRN